MPTSAADIGAFVVLVLPGFLAYRFAIFRRADPAERGTLWQLAEIPEYPVSGTVLFTLYPLYVVLSSIVIGAYDVPRAVGNFILRITGSVAKSVSTWPLLGWGTSTISRYPREPVWYAAFREIPQVLLLVKMKQGDIYYGELASYSLQPDERKEKDFLIRKARYYPGGDLSREYDLDKIEGFGAVLLNAADVDSIQVYYPPLATEENQ